MKTRLLKLILFASTCTLVLGKFIYNSGYKKGYDNGFESALYEIEYWGYGIKNYI